LKILKGNKRKKRKSGLLFGFLAMTTQGGNNKEQYDFMVKIIMIGDE